MKFIRSVARQSPVLTMILPVLAVLVVLTAGFTSEAAAAGNGEKQLVVGIWSAPEAFSPISNPSGYSEAVINVVFDPLVEHSDSLEYVPGLADDWSTGANGTEFTFALNPKARWHDGEPVTATDVVFTFTIHTHPETVTVFGSTLSLLRGTDDTGKAVPGTFSGVEKVDEHTVTFYTKNPLPEAVFLERIGNEIRIVPEHILAGVNPAKLHTHESVNRPIGSGPFRFVEYRTDQHVELRKHETYHKGTPRLDRLFIRIFSGPTLLAALERGEVDVTAGSGIGELPLTDWNRAQSLPHLDTYTYTPMIYQTLLINNNAPQFDDARVRRALALAVNRHRIRDLLFQGLAELHPTPLNSNNAFTDQSLVEAIQHDPAEARRLLEESDFDFRRRVVILTPTGNAERERSATLIQADLRAIGIQAEIEHADFASAYARMREGDYMLALLGSRSSFDPDLSARVGSEGDDNHTGYANERMDSLLAEARRTLDPDRRLQLHHEIQALFVEDTPEIILYSAQALMANNSTVSGVRAAANGRAPAGVFWNAETWDIEN